MAETRQVFAFRSKDSELEDIILTASKVLGISTTEFLNFAVRLLMLDFKNRVDTKSFDSSIEYFRNKPRTKLILSTILHWLDLKRDFYRINAAFLMRELREVDYSLVPEKRTKMLEEAQVSLDKQLGVEREIESIKTELESAK